MSGKSLCDTTDLRLAEDLHVLEPVQKLIFVTRSLAPQYTSFAMGDRNRGHFNCG